MTTVTGQECGTIPVISNADHNLSGSPPYAEGTTVTYTCQNLFRPQGLGLYTCTSGEWTGGPFSCQPIECSALEAPLHGTMIGNSYGVGSIMRFECNTGYKLKGSPTVLCLSDSNWDPPTVPECQIKTCPATPSIQNGNALVETEVDGRVDAYGGVLRVECYANHIVSGPVRIRCDENGQWTQIPICEPITCPPYEGLDGKCILKSKLEGQFFFLYCTDNATFVYDTNIGDGTAYCDNGNWDDPSMRCYCDCVVTADATLVRLDNLNANGFLPHDQILTWSCKHGSSKASNAALKCNDGTIGTPVCVQAPTQPTPPTTAHPEPKNKTTDTNVTVPGDKDEGVEPGIIVAIIAVLVALAGGVAGTLVAKKKNCLCFKNNHNSNVNANPPDSITEKSATVHYTNEKTDPNEKHPLDEKEKVDLGKDDIEKTPLMPFNDEQTDAEKGLSKSDTGKEVIEENTRLNHTEASPSDEKAT